MVEVPAIRLAQLLHGEKAHTAHVPVRYQSPFHNFIVLFTLPLRATVGTVMEYPLPSKVHDVRVRVPVKVRLEDAAHESVNQLSQNRFTDFWSTPWRSVVRAVNLSPQKSKDFAVPENAIVSVQEYVNVIPDTSLMFHLFSKFEEPARVPVNPVQSTSPHFDVASMVRTFVHEFASSFTISPTGTVAPELPPEVVDQEPVLL